MGGPHGKTLWSRYADPYGSWGNVAVKGTLKVTLRLVTARLSLDSDRIYIESETMCQLSDGTCLENRGGHSFWQAVPQYTGKFHEYGLINEGYAHKIMKPN